MNKKLIVVLFWGCLVVFLFSNQGQAAEVEAAYDSQGSVNFYGRYDYGIEALTEEEIKHEKIINQLQVASVIGEKIPQTGDQSPKVIWLFGLSLIAVASYLVMIKKPMKVGI